MSWPERTIALTASGYCSVQRALTQNVPGMPSRSRSLMMRQTPTRPP
jgi:hypothetical protein